VAVLELPFQLGQSDLPQAPSPASVALLLGLSFFLGLAFEDFFAQSPRRRPGGIRTFPMLALAGGVLYLLDPSQFIPFTGGLLVLGAWLIVYYRAYVGAVDEQGEPNVGIVVPILNIHAYLLGAVALALPPWVAVTMTVVAVLLLTGREQLHALARRVEIKEIVTAGQFLVLTGIVLPLLPNQPITPLTPITPRQVWLALVVVCTFSYVSYLAQRYWVTAAGGLWMAALGGLYSSTATTVVLARQAKAQPTLRRQAQAGITLATAIMYLRILAIVALFNLSLARALVLPICALSVAGFIFCAVQYWWRAGPEKQSAPAMHLAAGSNPLELGTAAIFALLFVAVSLATVLVKSQLGISGIYALAAVVGISDIDPFVLNLAQGGVAGMENAALAPQS
jgi:uncharacterized membrane protein (DUF4010 family)